MEGNVEGKGSASLPLDRPESSLMAIDPNMMARGLCERLNLSRSMGKGTVYEAVYDLALVEAAKGGDLAALCERMAAQQ
jgi:hypothetical protein